VSACVALATCAELPELADDEPLLLDELRARGVEAEPAVWDDPAVDWDRYALVVVRCTWDYSWRRDQFVDWAQSVPRLLNPADVIRWNTDKRYLAQLPGTVATEFVDRETAWHPPQGHYVVKPTVSSGSRHTGRYGPGDDDQARAHVGGLLASGQTVMVQPYLQAVDEDGETALLFFGGEYSHAIRKGQMLRPGREPSTDLFVEEHVGPRTPSEAERALADRVLDSLPWPRSELLYARVDLIPGADGSPQLIELELTEPSLYLSYGVGAAERLAKLVLERL
jgi:glutathione synthase/RimK-type ligase-like ATP-grasp enzyme